MTPDRRAVLGLGAGLAAATIAPQAAAQSTAPPVGAPQVGANVPPDPTEVIPIWPDAPPGGVPAGLTERVVERSTSPDFRDRYVQYVTRPTLTVFRPARPNGAAVLVVPGGGYRWVVIDKEGFEAARRFAEAGITSFVLRHRLPADGWRAGADAPLQDLQRAMRVIRTLSTNYQLDPAKVGAIGFSAGGHATASLATLHASRVYEPIDAADRFAARPDWAALMYPVITMTDPHVHAGSREHLLGRSPTPERVRAYSRENSVTADTPPTFLAHAMDDASVPPENGMAYLAALRRAGVLSEAHFFQEGGHGFGIRLIQGRPAQVWPDLLLAWLSRGGRI